MGFNPSYAWRSISPIRILDSNVTVDTLTDSEHNCWRVDIISDILLPIDKDRIIRIPLSTCGATDERI